MSYKYGKTSQYRLEECDIRLQLVMNRVLEISVCDISIITGNRSIEEQYEKFINGKSKIDGKTKLSKHNYYPSRALDFAPYINGQARFDDESIIYYTYIAGLIDAVSAAMGIKVRWGGNFDCDSEIGEQLFDDWGHIELI